MSGDLWYKSGVIYELYVKGFRDSNGNGRGDIRGVIEKLDYLQRLGIGCIWLLPLYPSPGRDDGYDIMDYYQIHPDYGTLDDFRRLIEEAHARNIRVMTDLVVNHTSDSHPWFVDAKRGPESPYFDYYVWSEHPEKYRDVRIIFTDSEVSNWTFCKENGLYYWHRFLSSPAGSQL
jgi:maltose alpha-D-glucosyltransferase / alpha-amylase